MDRRAGIDQLVKHMETHRAPSPVPQGVGGRSADRAASEQMNAPENEVLEDVGREAGQEFEDTPEEDAAAVSPEEGDTEDSDPDGTLDEPDPILILEDERDRLKDQHLRLAADFGNYRRRTEERLRQRWDRAQADLVGRFLDPLDDLRRVTALEPENTASVDAIVEGVDLVERKFFRALEESGVEVVDPVGEDFDPNTMEAMMTVPTESEADDDTVERVFQRGYTLKGILIRPARVSVFKAG